MKQRPKKSVVTLPKSLTHGRFGFRYYQVDGHYIGICEEFMGCLADGRTLAELKMNLKAVITLHLTYERELIAAMHFKPRSKRKFKRASVKI